jgi:hypothetical protein
MIRRTFRERHPRVDELGIEFGTAGPWVIAQLEENARLCYEHGRIGMTFRGLAHATFLKRKVQAKQIVSRASELGILDLIDISDTDFVVCFPRWDEFEFGWGTPCAEDPLEGVAAPSSAASRQRRYRQRLREMGVPSGIPEAVKREVMDRDNFTCQACGTQDEIQVDHIKPKSKGGMPVPGNLQVLCRPCNRLKWTEDHSKTTNPGDVTPVAAKAIGDKERLSSSSSSESSEPTALNPYSAEAIALCETLADLVAQNGSKRPRVTAAWLDSARLLLAPDRDGRPYADALALIRWCQNDDFWKGNVMSMPTFRKQYDQLRLKAQQQPQRHLKAVDSGRSYEREDLSGYDKFDGEDSA